jgi:arylsulfatase A-like enzyme
VPDHYRGDVLGHIGTPGAVTPNLDLIAAEGVSFSNAFCQNPVCSPSRCSFMSGRYPHVSGHRTMAHLMQPGEPVLLKTLKDAGYWTWWGGKNDLVAAQHGYSDYCDVKFDPFPPAMPWSARKPESQWRGRPGDDTYYSFFRGNIPLMPGEDKFWDHDLACVTGAVDLIREAPDGQPLCIYLPLIFPHLPYCVEEPWFSQIDRSKLTPRIPTPTDWSGRPSIEKGLVELYGMSGWSEQRWTELKAVYYAMCARTDHLVGMVRDAMQSKGIWDDTLFLFFSDHGEYAGDYGLIDINQNTFEDPLTRIPLIVKPPRALAARTGVDDSLVELLDIVATVEELAGVRMPHDHFSRSLVPLMTGSTRVHRDAVFCEGGRLRDEPHSMELDVGGALTTNGQYWPRLKMQRSWPEHGKAVMCRTREFKYVRRLAERDELYDLRNDPQELHNQIDNPDLIAVRTELRERVLQFFMETGDVVPRHLDRRS